MAVQTALRWVLPKELQWVAETAGRSATRWATQLGSLMAMQTAPLWGWTKVPLSVYRSGLPSVFDSVLPSVQPWVSRLGPTLARWWVRLLEWRWGDRSEQRLARA